jgi:TonB family protein
LAWWEGLKVKTRIAQAKLNGILAGTLLLACAGIGAAQEASNRKIIKVVSAQYPAVLKQRGIGGVVKMRVFVNANGTVKDAQILGGNAILADSALKAVKQWIFAPAAADAKLEISISFDPASQTAE